jgi:hypothetical protein
MVAAWMTAAPALAGEPAPTLNQCAGTFTTCMAACDGAEARTAAGVAGCQARCAANRATCEAEAGYETAKPWARRQLDALEDFLDGFRSGPRDDAPKADGPDAGGPYKDI